MKIISQETFDAVVLENVKEFGNEIEEAIDEAVKDFEAQGVQLSNIVKNPKLSDDGERIVHEVVESISVLKESLTSSSISTETLQKSLESFTFQCKLSLAHRVLVTKHDAFDVLLSLIKNSKNEPDMLSYALPAMTALTDTNPDILTAEGIQVLVDLLSDVSKPSYQNEEVQEALARWCVECCLKHENNRQNLFEAGAPAHLSSLLSLCGRRSNVAKATCKALRSFSLDDDIRIEFGKAHDHARMLVEQYNLIETCVYIIRDFMDDTEVTSEVLSTLSRLCVRAEYCMEVVNKGVLDVIDEIINAFPNDVQLNKQTINLLKTISGNDQVKDEVMKVGHYESIISAMVKHQASPGICEAGCAAIGMLALRVPAHAKLLVKAGASDAVVHAMKIHTKNKQIQKLGCMAVRNLAARVPENKASLMECEVENVIHTALHNHGTDCNFRDVAKAALRDLDLEVKLDEQWRGTGAEIGR